MFDKLKQQLTNLFWKPLISNKDKLFLESVSIKPFEKLPYAKFDNPLLEDILNTSNTKYSHGQHCYILKGNLTIEPSLSFVISGLRSIDYSTSIPALRRPQLSSYVKYLLNKKNFNTITIEKCVHLCPIIGINYFHFFSDIINKIWLLEKYNIDTKVPLVINFDAYKLPFVKDIINLDYFSKYTFIIQKKDDFIKAKEIICIRPLPYDINLWNKTLDVLGKKPAANPERKIFLTRKGISGRSIKNIEAVLSLITQYGFEVLYTEGLSLFDQKEIFENTKYFVSIHGAGITNIMFCNATQLRMLEIFPENRIGTQYYWMSNMLGIRAYDCMMSQQTGDSNAQFSHNKELEIDLDVLEKKLQRMLT